MDTSWSILFTHPATMREFLVRQSFGVEKEVRRSEGRTDIAAEAECYTAAVCAVELESLGNIGSWEAPFEGIC